MSRPALTRRVALTLLSLLAGITAVFAGGDRPSNTSDESARQSQIQTQGESQSADFVFDLNDGVIDLEVLPDGTVRYERDTMYGAFNVYRGEVDVMVSAGIYTQELVVVPGAKHWCDATTGSLMDNFTPPLGHIAFYVATGTRTDGESFPGQNSVHSDRPHHHPCHPCDDNGDCQNGTFCSKAPGNCVGKGVCARTPTACPDVWLPVCGCDGMTYSNACDAAAAGVSIARQGECSIECTTNAQCGGTEYCEKAFGACGATDVGHCAPRPQGCITLWMPVCGCDGVTYGNGCEAAAAGVNTLHNGACDSCTASDECSSTEYCAKSPGMCSEVGHCVWRPEYCTTHIDPVCGCNGTTYNNECEANRAGQSVAHAGACGCTTNADCPSVPFPGEFCLKPDFQCSAIGTCATRPTICPDVENDTCGCDGRIHMNSCVAHRNGTNVAPFSVCFP